MLEDWEKQTRKVLMVCYLGGERVGYTRGKGCAGKSRSSFRETMVYVVIHSTYTY